MRISYLALLLIVSLNIMASALPVGTYKGRASLKAEIVEQVNTEAKQNIAQAKQIIKKEKADIEEHLRKAKSYRSTYNYYMKNGSSFKSKIPTIISSNLEDADAEEKLANEKTAQLVEIEEQLAQMESDFAAEKHLDFSQVEHDILLEVTEEDMTLTRTFENGNVQQILFEIKDGKISLIIAEGEGVISIEQEGVIREDGSTMFTIAQQQQQVSPMAILVQNVVLSLGQTQEGQISYAEIEVVLGVLFNQAGEQQVQPLGEGERISVLLERIED